MKPSTFGTTMVTAAVLALGCGGAAWAQTAPQSQTPADASQPSEGSDQPVADTWITTKVKAELAVTEGVRSGDLSVKTQDGVVTLTGTQPSDTAAQKAQAAARSIKGVERVDVAGLKVDAAQAATDESDASSSAGEALSDGWITTKVKTELATTDGVKGGDVSVTTTDGVVTLTGVLDTGTAVKKAEAAAQSVKGVKDVDSAGLKARS